MNRNTALRLTRSSAPKVARQPRRWASYDRASLTHDALLEKVEAGLGEDGDGRPLKIDADAKTVSTAAGRLPISPLFDPAWMKARRRVQKAEPGPRLGRFRLKLANNPFARALVTPLRKCANTGATLPRYFLQDFELVKHPETGKGWWAPGPLSFDFMQPTKRPDEAQLDEARLDEARLDEAQAAEAPPAPEMTQAMAAVTAQAQAQEGASSETAGEKRPHRAPVTTYTLSKKAVVGAIGGPNRKFFAMMTGIRTGMAMGAETRDTVWRPDMGDILLRMMRREAVDALITRTTREHGPEERFVEACARWEDVAGVKLRGCVLWLPGAAGGGGGDGSRDAVAGSGSGSGRGYATLDVPGAKYGRKMPVYDLGWLLGEEETRRLREAAAVFRDNEILVMKQWPSISAMRLHLLLWRLQGYLVESPPRPRMGSKQGREGR
ncbi:hypothetical protein ESCO_002849 [Escovopsis weberi]|uniref:Esterase-like protein n=1 Tax=Escovopsis weberi TaxID=150374 RepID=A0A0M9VT14_ESCWE|nr:hypothetical protein ESCO_002849 [Escovopsis weberi]